MMLSSGMPLAFLVWFVLSILSSARLLQNDKVHWKGQSKGPALKARAEAPIIEDRSTQNFRFLTSATKRKVTVPIRMA
jgi:hypothetical protein